MTAVVSRARVLSAVAAATAPMRTPELLSWLDTVVSGGLNAVLLRETRVYHAGCGKGTVMVMIVQRFVDVEITLAGSNWDMRDLVAREFLCRLVAQDWPVIVQCSTTKTVVILIDTTVTEAFATYQALTVRKPPCLACAHNNGAAKKSGVALGGSKVADSAAGCRAGGRSSSSARGWQG